MILTRETTFPSATLSTTNLACNSGIEPGPLRWEAGDYAHESWHGFWELTIIWVICKVSARTAQQTRSLLVITTQLMLYRYNRCFFFPRNMQKAWCCAGQMYKCWMLRLVVDYILYALDHSGLTWSRNILQERTEISCQFTKKPQFGPCLKVQFCSHLDQ